MNRQTMFQLELIIVTCNEITCNKIAATMVAKGG